MRQYKYNETTYQMKTKSDEITLGEFQKILNIDEDTQLFVWLESVRILGLNELTDEIDANSLFDIIRDFNKDFKLDANKVRTFEIEGYTYSAFEEGKEFSLSARQLANIENYMVKNYNDWTLYAFATMFKRDDLSDIEHNDKAHIKYKTDLFKQVTVDIALPYIMEVGNTFLTNFNLLLNDEDK